MKPRRFIFVADSHGDMQDNDTVDAVLSFIKDFKPEIRCHLGDAYDFRSLRQGASDEERHESLQDDWEMGTDFLRRFFEGGSENHLLRGNHDERLWDMAASVSGMKREYAEDGIKRFNQNAKACKAHVLPFDAEDGVLTIGKLSLVHGYFHGARACISHALTYGNVIFGDSHIIENATAPTKKGAEARCIGCLCRRDLPYMKRKPSKLKWANGFAYGLLFPGGDYQIFQARKINGNFYTANEIKTY